MYLIASWYEQKRLEQKILIFGNVASFKFQLFKWLYLIKYGEDSLWVI